MIDITCTHPFQSKIQKCNPTQLTPTFKILDPAQPNPWVDPVFILGISGGKFTPPKIRNSPPKKIHIRALQPCNNSNTKSVKNTVKSSKLLPSDAFPRLKICQKCVCGRLSTTTTSAGFLQGVSGSCKPCISYDRDVCPSVCPSVRLSHAGTE